MFGGLEIPGMAVQVDPALMIARKSNANLKSRNLIKFCFAHGKLTNFFMVK